jgi:hypothetical protein
MDEPRYRLEPDADRSKTREPDVARVGCGEQWFRMEPCFSPNAERCRAAFMVKREHHPPFSRKRKGGLVYESQYLFIDSTTVLTEPFTKIHFVIV